MAAIVTLELIRCRVTVLGVGSDIVLSPVSADRLAIHQTEPFFEDEQCNELGEPQFPSQVVR